MDARPEDPHHRRLYVLIRGLFTPSPGRRRILLAWTAGLACHALFALAVLAMIGNMALGMQAGLGSVPWPWAVLANAALVAQFPLGHSALLSRPGQKLLARLAPSEHGKTLATTTYALLASVQLLALYALWTPSGVIWWQASGPALVATSLLYGASWLLLIKASWDAGAEVQSGMLGWMSLARGVRPVFPALPVRGLFRHIRHPIYLAFALTLWTVPTWTPDQLALASVLTLYCVLAPRLKEGRLRRLHGPRFDAYAARTPYMLPALPRRRRAQDTGI